MTYSATLADNTFREDFELCKIGGVEYRLFTSPVRWGATAATVDAEMQRCFPDRPYVIFKDGNPISAVEPSNSDGRDGTEMGGDEPGTSLSVLDGIELTVRPHRDSVWVFLGDRPIHEVHPYDARNILKAILQDGAERRGTE